MACARRAAPCRFRFTQNRATDRCNSDSVPSDFATLMSMRLTGRPAAAVRAGPRSEEHTSELQSLMRISYAVFCLKKKKAIQTEAMQPRTFQFKQYSHQIHITPTTNPITDTF